MADWLVLGGSYFVGRGIVDGLLEAGHRVSVLNRGTREVPNARQLVADRHQPEQLAAAVGDQRFDWIIDCCCYTAPEARSAYTALAAHARGWLHLSSAAVYADGAPIPAPEAGPLGASQVWGAYGLDKLAAERELEGLARSSATPIVALRAPYIYGPGENPDRDPWLWARLLRGRPILIPNQGATPIQFLHTQDLARAVLGIAAGCRKPGFAVFNAAESTAYSIRSYVELLAEVARVSADLRPIDYARLGVTPRSFFPFRDTPCVLDVSTIRERLGWEAQLDLRQGLTHTLASHPRSDLVDSSLDTRAEDALLEHNLGFDQRRERPTAERRSTARERERNTP